MELQYFAAPLTLVTWIARSSGYESKAVCDFYDNARKIMKTPEILKIQLYLFFFTYQSNIINRLIAPTITLNIRGFRKFRISSSARALRRSLDHETLTEVGL